PTDALTLFKLAAERAGGAVTSFELMSRMSVDFALRHGPGCRDPLGALHPWYVLIELSSQASGLRGALEDLLGAAAEEGVVGDAAIAASLDQRKAFWHVRDMLSDVQRFEGGSIKHDVSVPVAAVPDCIAQASAAVEALIPRCRPAAFGHLGDGNVHFNVSQPVGADAAAYLARWDEMGGAVNAVVMNLGGSISAEHGIGQLKRDLLPEVKDKVALELMRALKRTLDPNNILNPGKVL